MAAGDISTKRKEDKVQLIREPKVIIATLDVDAAMKLSQELTQHADKILQATANE